MTTALFVDSQFREHLNGAGHPERPERLEAIENALREGGLWDTLERPSFEAATEEKVLACHQRELVEAIHDLAVAGGGDIDPDTHVSLASYEVALLAVGAAVAAVDGVLSGKYSNAFVAPRPPGHHATLQRAMGFCLFNNIACAARHAQAAHGVERVAILDWDVHHGNGTQEIFYRDGSVFFASVHQWPLFPGTGRAEEKGEGEGAGTTLNFPLPAGRNNADYVQVWHQIGAVVSDFKPQLILVSAGFDAHANDPLGSMELTADGFGGLMRATLDWASTLCEGRVVALLEGGYDLTGLAQSTAAVVREMRGEQ